MAHRRRRGKVKTEGRTSNAKRRVHFTYHDIGDIVPYDRNPRDNEQAVESVANSIDNFGFVVPIVIDGSNVIVCGHTRYEAAIRLGLTEVPTIPASHLTPEQVDAFRVIDNKVSELARWDFDALSGEITSLQSSGIDFTQFGFNREELDCLTDVVNDDCLSGEVVEEMSAGSRNQRAEKRAPNRTRMVLGEFVFFVPTEVYRSWANEMRNGNGYEEAAIIRDLKDRLQLSQYEEQHSKDNP